MQIQPKKVYYRGKALVVGNDHYDQVKPDLDNAVNDAKGNQCNTKILSPKMSIRPDFRVKFMQWKLLGARQ